MTVSFDADSVMWAQDARDVLLFLVNVTVKSTIVLSVAAFVATVILRRRSAAMRHVVWLVALGAVLVMPIAIRVLPNVNVVVPGLPVASMIADAAPTSPDLADFERPSGSVHRNNTRALHNESAASSLSSPPTRQSYFPILDWKMLLLFAWLVGAAFLLTRVAVSHFATRKLTRTADPILDGPLPELLESLRHDLGVSRHVMLLEGELVGVPTTLRSIKPVILLPTAWRDWTSDRARAVLLHELAHVKRYDCAAQLIGHFACALHWPNPVVWWVTRQLLHERERACDDKVLELGTRASDYANDLLEIARDSRMQPSLSLAAVTMARPSQLEGRLLSILDPAVSRTTSMTVRLATTSSIVLLALGLAAVRPTAAVQLVEPITEERQTTPATVPGTPLPEATPSVSEIAAAVLGAEVDTAIRDSIAATTDAIDDAVEQQLDAPDNRQTVTPPPAQATTDARNRAVLEAFLAALQDADADIRKDAAWVLGQRREPGAFDSLLAAIKDESPDVREQVAWALGRWRDRRALDALVAALQDMAPDVQQQAAWALGQLRDARAVTPLTTALQEAEDDVREQAAWALGQIRDRQATGALVAALEDAEPNVQQQAAWALGQLRDPSALDGLMAALKASDAEVRQEAAWALGQLRDDRATDALVVLTKDLDAEIRRTALRALAELGDLKNGIGSRGNPNPNPNPDPGPKPDPNPLPKPRLPR